MISDYQPNHDFLVGIDSDGCVFDTMEVKHKECFIPNIIKYYNLASISKYAREASEFINLYSKWRGVNRFPALTLTFDLLVDRPEVVKRGVKIPHLPSVRKWIDSESKLGNPALAEAAKRDDDPELWHLLEWSKAVNETVSQVVHDVPPFPGVRESLQKLQGKADVFVVSATPNEALTREWEENDIRRYVERICGQESGSKKETLELARKYPPGHALMVGDAPGDRKAAKANNALFFPINPGHEDASWQRLLEEGIDRFLSGTFAGEYEDRLNEEFESYLPEHPPWKLQAT